MKFKSQRALRGTTTLALLFCFLNAQAHLAADHPGLVGKVSRADILAQAEEI